jgi:hypothetical protein
MNEHEPPTTRDEALLRFLANRDVPCPVCGYNLRSAASDRCPECGGQFEFCPGSLDLRLGPWILMLIAASIPLGFVVLALGSLGLVMVIEYAVGGRSALGIDHVVLGLLAVGVVCAAALWAMAKRRRAIWKMSPRRQWAAAIAAWVATAAIWALIFVLIETWG